MSNHPPVGSISWHDLTVPDATHVRDFYSAVVGWQHTAFNMGEYSDYCMIPSAGTDPVAGVCHARGPNAGLPAQWLVYITVADIEASARKCVELGGAVIDGPKDMGGGRICVIRDPAGAVAGLYQTIE